MNIRFYETFILLSSLNSISKTANRLNATQPTIHGRLSALEDSLGVKLYVKGSKPLQLTPEGKGVLQYAKSIVSIEHELKSWLATKNASGTLRIGAIEMVTMTWLPEFIRTLRSKLPGLSLEICTGTVQELTPKIMSEDLDLAFILGPQNDFELCSTPLCSLMLWWIANPKHFPTSEEIDIQDLAKLPIVLVTPKASTFPYVRDYFSSYGLGDIFIDKKMVKIDCGSSALTALCMVKSGLGVAPAPAAFALHEMRQDPSLTRLRVRQELPSVHVTASFKDSNRSLLLQEAIEVAVGCARTYANAAPEGTVWV